MAVATAAIVLGFLEDNATIEGLSKPADFDSIKSRILTKSGMEQVLCKMCVDQKEGMRAIGPSYITPWYFLQIDPSCRLGMILNLLRHTPEG